MLWNCTPLLDGMEEGVTERHGLRAIAIEPPALLLDRRRVEPARSVASLSTSMRTPAVADAARLLLRALGGRGARSRRRPDACSGSAVTSGRAGLHWGEGNALLAGDAVAVVSDRRYVSFMYSYPNLIPLPVSTIRGIVEKLEPWEFDRIYGGWWGEIVARDGKEAVRRSAERYIAAIEG